MNNQQRMPLEELQQTPEFLALTKKQQLFVATYVQGGEAGEYDPVEAVMVAYKCKNRNIARIMSYNMLSNIRIVAALNRHWMRAPLDAFLLVLDRAIRNRHLKHAQVEALRLKCELLGIVNNLPHSGERSLHDIAVEIQKATNEQKKTSRKSRKSPEPEVPSAADEMSKKIFGH